MKLSLNWLQDFVTLTEKNKDTIKAVITARSAEIETMESTGAHLENIVVGQIKSVSPHPNADKLRLVIVHDGAEDRKVVCGGSNLAEGMKVAFAKIGAVVSWHGGEKVKIVPAKIRGEESFGMICGADEIGLLELFPKKSAKEIVDLSALKVTVGAPLASALGMDDTLIDIDNHALTHRPDLFSHFGFAREFVACGLAKWKKISGQQTAVSSQRNTFDSVHTPSPIELEIEKSELCSNYLGVYLTGVEVGESPDWMKKRLTACGIRPISNLVDITNYVMLELGMPLHAFDLDQVKGKKWTMRSSKKGEKIVTLDQKEIDLGEGAVVLDDGHSLFDLCGIMGGFNSGVNAKTNRIWLHAPVYNATLVRRAMRRLNAVTDAGIIYEKNIDPQLAWEGLNRAVQLILEICPGARVASAVTHLQNSETPKRVLNLPEKRLETLIGLKIPAVTVKKILTNLGFGLTKAKGGWNVTVPTWRYNDVNQEADLIEEVARVYGYDAIPFTLPSCPIQPILANSRRRLMKEFRDQLASFGLSEINTFAFLGSALLAKCKMATDAGSIFLANPLSNDLSVMRQSLLPRTLETIAANLRYSKTFGLFELSRTFHKKDQESIERHELIAATAGEPFRKLQGMIEAMRFTVSSIDGKTVPTHQHPGRVADLQFVGKKVGVLYEIHPEMAKTFDLKTRVTVAEIDFDLVHELNVGPSSLASDGAGKKVTFKELPKFPSVELDVSLSIPRKMPAETCFKIIRAADQTLIRDVKLIDEYEGDKIEKGQRSLTFSIVYRSDTATLTEDQVKAAHEKALSSLRAQGVTIRI